MWTAVKGTDIPIYYKRHVFSAELPEYRGTFAVDFVVPPYTDTDTTLPPRTTYYTSSEFAVLGSDDEKPMLIVLHGLSGGSYEIYLRSAIRPLVDAGHVDVIKQNPRIDVERVRAIKYLHEFDRELQGPTWGYPTEGAYYRDASSVDSLLGVRIPLLAINAVDDPIAHREAIPFMEFTTNPYTVLCATAMGGHLSWFETGGTRWFAKPLSNFFTRIAECREIDPQTKKDTALAGEDVSVAATVSPFVPTRRKLVMIQDP
ncbi:MAG: hypothetical protein GOMPHAMPRED_001120 [Gomphillus americanus]|uniref:AB hydrolase-1 domain-containing protein n=1 Tax=Gomphillus americanus TaxID=1940652 RepID=A0A8H3F457_9LECA|nr:MAG: hypothetical protein GOMPHAMPRED_001120 [Gomphillus americanus]